MQLYPREQFDESRAPQLVVDRHTFRRLATVAGWDDHNINLCLRPPVSPELFKVGQVMVRLIDNSPGK